MIHGSERAIRLVAQSRCWGVAGLIFRVVKLVVRIYNLAILKMALAVGIGLWPLAFGFFAAKESGGISIFRIFKPMDYNIEPIANSYPHRNRKKLLIYIVFPIQRRTR